MSPKHLFILSGACFLTAFFFLPGEFIVQVGLRKIAFEQGLHAASQQWDFVAAPQSEPNPEPKPKQKVARR